MADLVEPGRYIASPTTTEEIAQDIRYMLSSGSNQLTLQYSGISAIQARQVMEKALSITKSYCEQSYNSVTCSFPSIREHDTDLFLPWI